MKILILHFLSCGLAITAFADGAGNFSITNNQAPDVRQRLEAFEKGAMTLEDLTESGDQSCLELIDYYFMHTNDVSVKSKLPISRCFAATGKYQQAAQLAAEYVRVYSNDWHGWKILGGANVLMGNFNAAIQALTNSAKLGDERSYAPLSLAALKMDRLDVVSNLVSHLLVLKNESNPPEVNPLDILTVLTTYAVKADREDLFIKALDGVSAKQIASREDLNFVVRTGCDQFKGKSIDNLRKEMESAIVSTNGIGKQEH